MRALPARRVPCLAKKSKGFTLIELALVAAFMGMLALFAVSQFSGSASNTTRANGLYDAAQKISVNWGIATARCGVTPLVASSPLAATPSAANNLSVLLGTQAVNSAYSACFVASGVRPLYGLTTGPAGNERLFSYPVVLANSGTNYRQLLVAFSNVPETVALPLYQKHSSQAGAATAPVIPAAADTTDNEFRFSAPAADSSRTITLVMPL